MRCYEAPEDDQPLFSQWTVRTWLLATAQAWLGLLGTIAIYRALHCTSPTHVMVIRSFQVVLSYIVQVCYSNKVSTE